MLPCSKSGLIFFKNNGVSINKLISESDKSPLPAINLLKSENVSINKLFLQKVLLHLSIIPNICTFLHFSSKLFKENQLNSTKANITVFSNIWLSICYNIMVTQNPNIHSLQQEDSREEIPISASWFILTRHSCLFIKHILY